MSVICILLAVSGLFASGRKDANLTAADDLIAQGKLNEAMLFLEEYIKRRPEDFDGAQRRIDRIFALRNKYTDAANELIDVIIDEPLNDEKKLALVDRLERQESDPTETERAFVAETKIASQFTYYRAVFDSIMKEGAALLNGRRFTGAARRFADGLTLYRSDFYEDFAGTELLEKTDAHLTEVSKALDSYEALQNTLASAAERFNAALAEYDTDRVLESYRSYDGVLREYAAVRNVFMRAGLYFQMSFAQMKKDNPELTEASFLPFAYRFLLGRTSNPDTGIVRVLDRQWEILCSQSRELLTAFIEKKSTDIAARLPDAAQSTTADSQKLTRIADIGKEFISLYTLFEGEDAPSVPSFYASYDSALDYNKVLTAHVQKFIAQKETFDSEKKAHDDISSPPLRELQKNLGVISYADTLTSYAAQKVAVIQTCAADIRALDAARSRFSAPPWESLYTALSRSLARFAGENDAETLRTWEKLSSFVVRSSSFVRERYETSYGEARALINEDSDPSVSSQPEEALTALQKIQKDLAEDVKAATVRFDLLSGAPAEPVLQNPGSPLYAANLRSARSDLEYFNNLVQRIAESSRLAQTRIRLALQAQNEADFRYSQALAALQREDFDASRESLQQARNKYNESLSYRDSHTLRAQTDKKLDALGADIVRLENGKVVRDVRLLITSARSLYYNGDFEQAERLILQAEDRWAVTNVEQNPEVVNLKALIGNALSIRTGRSVPVTDPLYPEISQTLNAAYQYFEEGRQKINSGSRSAGMELLNTAREKIKDVQVLYPLNQEANLLALRIAKFIDPAGFEELFRQRYNTARSEYRNPATVNRAYADLKDLYEINPKYPGLKKLIYDMEVELGIIVPPPDPQKIARAARLVNEARRQYEANPRNEIVLNGVLSKLDEALTLNPENSEAAILVDRIKTGMGGQSLVVLTAGDELLYQKAVQELSKGNTITAAALVAELWRNTKLRKSAKVIDLKNKVDSLL
ncbi:hypothetical protein [Treponema maltophilum]|uniref:hypothetical protein n=1 Tax=Treponema maltophilum TaxID=51160 RepID=UPI003D90D0D1